MMPPTGAGELGKFKLLAKDAYPKARDAADAANKALHRTVGEAAKGKHFHENVPVKFNGNPTAIENKTLLSPTEHSPYTSWWAKLQNNIERGIKYDGKEFYRGN
jgi:hypothetical protein